MTRHHLKVLFTQLDSSRYKTLLFFIKEGAKSPSKDHIDMKHTLCTSNSVTTLCEYIIKKSGKNTPERQAISRALSEHPSELSELLELMLGIVLTENSNFMWSLSKPLLGMIVLNESSYESIKNFVISRVTNSSELRSQLNSALNSLMEGITRSLDQKNRERFGKRFTELLQAIGTIIN